MSERTSGDPPVTLYPCLPNCCLFCILPAEEPGSLGSVARLGHEQANCIRINLRWVVLAWKILRWVVLALKILRWVGLAWKILTWAAGLTRPVRPDDLFV